MVVYFWCEIICQLLDFMFSSFSLCPFQFRWATRQSSRSWMDGGAGKTNISSNVGKYSFSKNIPNWRKFILFELTKIGNYVNYGFWYHFIFEVEMKSYYVKHVDPAPTTFQSRTCACPPVSLNNTKACQKWNDLLEICEGLASFISLSPPLYIWSRMRDNMS